MANVRAWLVGMALAIATFVWAYTLTPGRVDCLLP